MGPPSDYIIYSPKVCSAAENLIKQYYQTLSLCAFRWNEKVAKTLFNIYFQNGNTKYFEIYIQLLFIKQKLTTNSTQMLGIRKMALKIKCKM